VLTQSFVTKYALLQQVLKGLLQFRRKQEIRQKRTHRSASDSETVSKENSSIYRLRDTEVAFTRGSTEAHFLNSWATTPKT